MPVTLHVVPDRFPPTVEATAWFVVNEGLTNAVKHAHPQRITADLRRRDGQIRVEVTDDGVGGAGLIPGGGLQGLADRVAAVGGTFQVHSSHAGTTITAELPCE